MLKSKYDQNCWKYLLYHLPFTLFRDENKKFSCASFFATSKICQVEITVLISTALGSMQHFPIQHSSLLYIYIRPEDTANLVQDNRCICFCKLYHLKSLGFKKVNKLPFGQKNTELFW